MWWKQLMIPVNPNPTRAAVGKVWKKLIFQRERRGGDKCARSAARGSGLETGTYRVLGESQYHHATMFVLTSKLFSGYKWDRAIAQ